MQDKTFDNHTRYLERIKLYKSFGYDLEAERKFILEKAYPLYGDILEVGTGKGHFALELAKAGYKFVSIDISVEAQEFAKLNLKYFGLDEFVDFQIQDAEYLSFDDSSFDIIFSINTVHHLLNPHRVIEQLIRVADREGKIILSDFTKKGLGLIAEIHKSEGAVHCAGEVGLDDIAEYLQTKNFKTEEYSSQFQKVLIAYHQLI